VFDDHYKEKFLAAGLLDKCGGDLQHLISDAATMQIIRWTGGGFGMAAHNYDGDMLTDEIAQVHRSPGFITSNLIGKMPDGRMIKEFEASHGTVADLYHMMLRGEETSFNPLGMVEALIGAMQHAATLDPAEKDAIDKYCLTLRKAMHQTFREGNGTRDMCGPTGLTTEQFLDKVIENFVALYDGKVPELAAEVPVKPALPTVDKAKVKDLFDLYDLDKDGSISMSEFENALVKLGVAPMEVRKAKNKTSEITDNVKP
jgi:isocitrate dehydrogenase